MIIVGINYFDHERRASIKSEERGGNLFAMTVHPSKTTVLDESINGIPYTDCVR